MNVHRPTNAVPRHPLFRAMVLMGNGIAIGCGGTTAIGRGQVGDGTGGGSPEPGTSDTGGLTGAGGSAFVAAGGAAVFGGTGGTIVITGTGGTIPIASGGATNNPPPNPLPCVPAQYDCSGIYLGTYADCSQSQGRWILDPNCTCNPKRPRSASDCAAGTTFVCRNGAATANAQPPGESVPFECSCVPSAPSCPEACTTAFPIDSGYFRVSCSDEAVDGSVLCGCAFIGLK